MNIHLEILTGSYERVRQYLSQSPDPAIIDSLDPSMGNTPLMTSVLLGCHDIFKLLLNHNPRLELKNRAHQNVFDLARSIRINDVRIHDELMSLEQCIQQLFILIETRQIERTRELLKHFESVSGFHINRRHLANNMTPLHATVLSGNIELVKLVLEHDPDLSLTYQDKTAYQFSLLQSNPWIKRLLQKRHIQHRGIEFVYFSGPIASICRAKKREGGIGPIGYLEVSQYAQSNEFFKNLPLDRTFDFVFDLIRGMGIVLSKELHLARGHDGIIDAFGFDRNNLAGGRIRRLQGATFGSSEWSGHYGHRWDLPLRWKFIDYLTNAIGVTIYHLRGFQSNDPNAVGCEEVKDEQLKFMRQYGKGSLWNAATIRAVYPSQFQQDRYRYNNNYVKCASGSSFKPIYSFEIIATNEREREILRNDEKYVELTDNTFRRLRLYQYEDNDILVEMLTRQRILFSELHAE